jgi:DNA-binding MarR family transcriptional regulator
MAEQQSARADYQPAALQSSTLMLLRRLLDVAGRSGPAVARRAGLSPHELTALDMLAKEQHGPAELARRLGVTSAAASGIVDRLVARGHVERMPRSDDRRRTRVVLTESGRREIIGHLRPMFLVLVDLDSRLTDEERVVVDRYLAGAIEAVERVL